ncbi:hypothetical protein GCM10008090_00590 [Arenicella chitinivorans]|uniref:BLUF domain-containing protein n=1 Tax=Arenicella chitinivorans TaxID=1329800 RepID=A0A918RHA3_9GAMM|nr:BLUF domain-containing protein [Arenicella chitinivorans]GGZ96251.1 hypothetical protein GCM10008090_00590 [Arenicella chitinivorans]
MYISRVRVRKDGVVIPVGLSDIYARSRKRNAERGISSVMSFRKAHYLQIIEGKVDDVDALFANICDDPRHTDVEKLLDCSISDRFFPKWSFKLLESVQKAPEFIRFVNRHNREIGDFDAHQTELLQLFYDLSKPRVTACDYSGKELMLRGWPDFSEISQSPTIIELCARLTKRPHTYESLVDGGDFGTRRQIDVILQKLDRLELLNAFAYEEDAQLATASSGAAAVTTANIEASRSNGFYGKMREFLFKSR